MKKLLSKIKNSAIFSSWIVNVIQLSSSIIILPVLLKKFSAEEISMWLLLNTISGIALLSQVGFGNATIRGLSFFLKGATYIPKNSEEFDTREVESDTINVDGLYRVIGTVTRIFSILQVVCFVLVSSFGIMILWNVVSLSDHKGELWLSLFVVVLSCVISIRTVKLMSIIQALGKISYFNNVKSIAAVAKVFLLFVISIFFPSILFLVLVGLAEVIVDLVVAAKLSGNALKEKIPEFDKRQCRYEPEIFNSLWPSSWKLGVIQIGAYLISYSSSIVVAQLRDAQVVAAFLVTKRILDIVRVIAQAPFYANIELVYQSVASRNEDSKFLVSKYISILTYIFLFCTLFLAFAGNSTLSTLDMKVRFLTPELIVLAALALFLEAHHSMHATIYLATSDVPFIKPALISGVAMMLLNFLFLKWGGITAIILIQLIVQLIYNNWYPVYLSLRMLKWPFKQYLVSVISWPVEYSKKIKLYHGVQ